MSIAGFLKNVFLLFFFVFFPAASFGQFVNYGTDPASFKWRQATTAHYKLIYPEGNDSVAYNYARLLELAYPREMKTIGHDIKRKFPVILHPGNMLSNGMVAYAPRRMELLPTASPSLYAQSWDRQLVVHESRHVLQTDKLTQGIFEPFYYLFGEQISGVSSALVPRWFFEGDAVATETGMSKSGRGRLPEFHLPFRARMVEGDFFTFDKWYMGSYKDHTSTYYALGYHLTSFARAEYGADIWDKVTSRYTRRFFSLPPFSNALKHYTGSNTKQLFKDTYACLNLEWKRMDSLYHRSGFEGKQTLLSPQTKYYTSFQYPVALNDKRIVALKTGLSEISSIVAVEDGKESRLAFVGNVNSRLIHSGNRIYWTEYVPGLRWTHQNYSVLKSLDLTTGKIATLTRKDRLLTPAVNEPGTRFAFSRPGVNGRNELLLMDVASDKEIATFAIPDNAFVKDLLFTGESSLAALVIGARGISILELDCATAQWKELLSPVPANISSLYRQKDYLYFESGADGTNNIYRMALSSGQTERMTNARFGAFTPSLSSDGNTLLFSDYRPEGYRVVSVPVAELNPTPADLSDPYRFSLAEVVAEQEGFNLDTAEVGDIPFSSKPYRKPLNLLRVHSWAPFYYDAMDAVNIGSDDFSTIVKPGAMVLSQDALNTTIMQAGVYYKDRDWHGKMALTYMGLFPVLNLTVDYGGNTYEMRLKKDEEGRLSSSYVGVDRSHVEAEALVYLPFNFSGGHIVRGFQPSVAYYFTNDKYQQYKSGKLSNFQYVLSELRYYNYRKMASRDIYPRLGYQIRLQHLFSPLNSDNFGNLYAARLTTYLPGLRMNDGLMLRFGYQYQSVEGKLSYFPKRLLDNTRGYDYLYRTQQLFTAKADYAFNLFCPDLSIGNLAYVKRFRSNLFYDFTANKALSAQKTWDTYNATGIDLIADCNFLRLNFPVSIGARMIVPLDYGSAQMEGLFAISF